MKFIGISLLLFVTTAVLLLSEASAKPVTAINKLPSITTDTLYSKVPAEDDSETSESMGLIRTMMLGGQAFQNTLRPRQEASYVTLFRLPWRIARSVSQTSFGMAKGFMDAFSHQFIESYKNMQQNVIPQASEAFAVWSTPPKPNLETPWLDGGV